MGFGLGVSGDHKGQKMRVQGRSWTSGVPKDVNARRKTLLHRGAGGGLSIDANEAATRAFRPLVCGRRPMSSRRRRRAGVDGVASMASAGVEVVTQVRELQAREVARGRGAPIGPVALEISRHKRTCYDAARGAPRRTRPSPGCKCGAPNCIAIGNKKNVVKSKGYQSGSDDEDEVAARGGDGG